jgi:hypothetical protein
MAKLILALALVDLLAHGVKAGQVIEGEANSINALAKDGQVDTHKDALAYAKSEGRAVVRSAIVIAAEKAAEAREALLVEIAKLEDLLGKADNEDTKAALGKEVESKRGELAALA